ncbi:MAG: dephospho-CoA kinase [Syntrophaceae bacterium]|nr:dephospho-CoA kinase [Syntrophaceae bacterium]
MEQLLRLKTFPVAFKLLENRADLSAIPYMRRVGHKSTLCQLINLVRSFDWTVGADDTDMVGPMCTSIIGLTGMPEFLRDGTFRSIIWTKTRRDGEKYENAVPRIPPGKYQAVAMAPLAYNPFDPDLILIYANPAQMILLINALQFEDYEVMQFFCVGESSCSDAIARCHLTGRPSLTIPCFGERRYGHTQDDELVMALPPAMLDKAVDGLETLYKRGIRYPISMAGAELDLGRALPGAYATGPAMIEGIRSSTALLLGVTGSIATGKSTVSRMLEELGSPLIDFDVLARIVVEPGQPALKDIAAYFGSQVLQEDGALDRKKLSEIIFTDMEKRKKLESFVHPRIGEAFMKQVQEHALRNPDAIIQVAVPLLIETNMNFMFDKLLLVYTPPEEQARRLMERDGVNQEMAAAMVGSQMSVEEKKSYVDFVIDNSGAPEETRRQVEDNWMTLQELQREKAQRIKERKETS